MTENKIKPWIVLVLCCMVASSSMGLLSNSVGVFYTPVSEALGVMRGNFTLHITISSLVSAFMALIIAKVIVKYNFKPFILGGAILACGSTCLMGFCTQLWQFYVLGAIRGLGINFFSMIVLTMIINYWFVGKHGLATSLVMSFSGIAGAVGSPLITSAISSIGWEKTYVVYGLVSFLLVLPAVIYPFKLNPRQEGLLPYGYVPPKEPVKVEHTNNIKPKEKSTFKLLTFSFMAFIIVVLCIIALTCMPQHFPGYAVALGFTTTLGASMLSASMFGNISAKMVFGILSDKIGSFYTSVVILAVNLCSLFILLFVKAEAAMIIAAFLFGTIYSMGSVGIALLCKDFFGIENYNVTYPKVTFAIGISGAVFASLIGYVYDFTGGYTAAILMLIAFHAIIFASLLFLSAQRKRGKIG